MMLGPVPLTGAFEEASARGDHQRRTSAARASSARGEGVDTEVQVEAVALGFRFALGGLFVLAGAAKLASLETFENSVRDYRILPGRLVRPVSRVLPPTEVSAGALMGLGVAVVAVGVLMTVLLAIFAMAVAINLVRGRSIDCGCLGGLGSKQITWGMVARNLLLAAAAAIVAAVSPGDLAVPVLGSVAGRPTLAVPDALAVLLTTATVLLAIPLLVEGLRVRKRMSSGDGVR
jgi:hypothetical protein